MRRWQVLTQLVDHFCPNNAIGAEIGIDRAYTSTFVLENSKKLGHLYCIDPYVDRTDRREIVKQKLGLDHFVFPDNTYPTIQDDNISEEEEEETDNIKSPVKRKRGIKLGFPKKVFNNQQI